MESAATLGPRALSDFAGRWLLERVIDDRRAGQTGRFAGTATILADGAGVTYDECGLLTLGAAAPVPASRRYLWRPDGPRIAVLFADGRPFHSFAPDAREAEHWCDPDSYRVAYDFHRWPVWTAAWVVAGPRKDHTITSCYRPVDALR